MYKENVSAEHAAYLKKVKTKNIIVIASRWLLLLLMIGLWELAARLEWIDPFIFSSPSRIVATTINLIKDGSLFQHVGITLYETLIGFFLGILIGLIIATLLWASETVSRILDPYLVILNALPKIALGPVIIVWAGSGTAPIIIMTLLISVIVTIMGVLSGFMGVDKEKITLMKSFGANKRQIFLKVVLPASVPSIASAIKINVGMTWVGVIMGEFLVSKAGLGYLIVYGGQVFKLDLVMSGVVILCILASIMYFIVAAIEKRLQ